MLRYIYCPDESFMDEAEKMASEFSLPIMVGYAEVAKNAEFDRKKVGFVLVPEQPVMEIPQIGIRLNKSFIGHYSNDYFDSSKIELFVVFNGKETQIGTKIQDPRCIFFSILPKSTGHYVISVRVDGEQIETHEFNVGEEE
jgi:predicted aspartyl protease